MEEAYHTTCKPARFDGGIGVSNILFQKHFFPAHVRGNGPNSTGDQYPQKDDRIKLHGAKFGRPGNQDGKNSLNPLQPKGLCKEGNPHCETTGYNKEANKHGPGHIARKEGYQQHHRTQGTTYHPLFQQKYNQPQNAPDKDTP